MVKISSLLFASMAFIATYTSGVSADAWSDSVLSAHNAARAQYGARPLTWNAALYPGTFQYAQTCKFAHSDAQRKYGENLYVSSAQNASINDAVAAWMKEVSKYDYNHPGFSPATGKK
ncbi:hypothetical protein EC973_008402 [Apophysomyces ossiformis]|uniref:SCP domain-containing protein n=1 Tax=Apophysomyces ossiformis TaxID=679940 RepID=A0A8H7ETP9_9FUNG|nr:hypothetical protein EC973_008402 [Apophysomyces ossiformis]